MGIVIRQSFWNSVVSYVGVALGAFNMLWLFPQMLEEAELGLTRMLLAGAMIAAQFAQLGMGNVTFRFFPMFQDPENGHRGFLRLTAGVPFVGLLVCVGLFFAFRPTIASAYAENAELFVTYDLWLLPLLAFTLYFNVFDAWLRSHQRTVASSLIREVILRLMQSGTVAAYALGWLDFHSFVAAFVLVHGVQTVMAVVWTAVVGELKFGETYAPPETVTRRQLADYSLFVILGGISAMVVSQLDILMVGSMVGEAAVAVYAVAFYIGTFIMVPERSISKISYPLIAKAFQEHDYGLIERIYQKSSLNQIVIGVLIFVGIWANTDNAVAILPEGYEMVRNVMVIITAAKLFDMATGANGIILMCSPWYRFDLVTNVLLVALTVATNLMLIPVLGVDGAAWATLITIVVYNVVKLVFIWLKMDMQPLQPAALKALLAGGVAWGASTLVPVMASPVLDVLVRSAAITAVYGLCVVSWRVSDDVNRMLRIGRG